jgi:hypothetical protein
MITYGGMSRRPVMVPTGRQIFNDISLRGFWLSRWVQQNSKEERQKMINALTVRITCQQPSASSTHSPTLDHHVMYIGFDSSR